jgi:hypothetical protein
VSKFLVYIEHDDGHNEPTIVGYDSDVDAVGDIAEPEDNEEAYRELFGEEGFGEWHTGTDKYTVITEDSARGKSSYWDEVAEAIRFGKEPP